MANPEFFETKDEYLFQYSYSYGGISRYFREIVENKELYITRCSHCGKGFCPPRVHCPECWEETTWERHSGRGEVMSAVYCYWTPINSPIRKYVQPPYIYALVKLDGTDSCLNVLVHTRDLRVNETVRTGTRVRICYREQREGKISDYYFVPENEYVESQEG